LSELGGRRSTVCLEKCTGKKVRVLLPSPLITLQPTHQLQTISNRLSPLTPQHKQHTFPTLPTLPSPPSLPSSQTLTSPGAASGPLHSRPCVPWPPAPRLVHDQSPADSHASLCLSSLWLLGCLIENGGGGGDETEGLLLLLFCPLCCCCCCYCCCCYCSSSLVAPPPLRLCVVCRCRVRGCEEESEQTIRSTT